MPDQSPRRLSRSYLLPVEDTEFLLRDEMRSIRFALEYSKAELGLRDHGIESTVVVFGSARVPSPEQAEYAAKTAKGADEVEAAQKKVKLSRWYQEARTFARIVSERGGALASDQKAKRNVIATGGGPGIMEAANRGAHDVGAPTIGFNITLPHEQEPNAFSSPDLTYCFHYFGMRKMHLAMRARALAIFPGGFGTLDEMFEILTLEQTGKAPTIPVVLFGRDYWPKLINFETMVEWGMVNRGDLNLFEIVDTAEEAWAALIRRGLQVENPFIGA